jgi:hypothetical protein
MFPFFADATPAYEPQHRGRATAPRQVLWTLPREEAMKKSSKLVERPQLDDIEGTRTALKQFRRGNQRIVADPYPLSYHAPRQHTPTVGRHNVGDAPISFRDSPAARSHSGPRSASGRPLRFEPPYYSNGAKRDVPLAAERIFYDRSHGRYFSREEPLREVGRKLAQLEWTPGRGLSARDWKATKLDISDIEGARPRSQTPPLRNRPNRDSVRDINYPVSPGSCSLQNAANQRLLHHAGSPSGRAQPFRPKPTPVVPEWWGA